MSDLVVQRVTSPRQREQFLEFPWILYRNDPHWIPPLRDNQRQLVGYASHPFYARNSVQTFLALRGKEVCGRVAAILNQGHNERYRERLGFFGFFECADDQEAASGLFDAVREWFARQGICRLRGPANPSLNYELGLLIDGFDSPPTFMMTYNPPYYPRLVEGYGFRKSQDLYAYLGHIDMLPSRVAKLKPIVEQIVAHLNVCVRPLDKSHFFDDVKNFLAIYNRSLTNTWGFVPMSDDEVHHMAEGLRYLIVPDLAVAAEIAGKMIGAVFALPDYNPRIRQIDGRLFPFGFIRLLGNKKQIKRVRIISTNVLPEYQLQGVGLVLMAGLAPMAKKWGLQEAEFSWVLESNSLSRGSLEKGGAQRAKTYRMYDLDAASGGPAVGTVPIFVSTKMGLSPLTRPWVPRWPAIPSGPLEVREVRSRSDLDRFIRLPWSIYGEDPHWVPPLLVEVRKFLDRRRHPFYGHGEATQLLALRGGAPAGRILVSDDPACNRHHASNAGCFGMFECVDDRDTAHALLDAAATWLRARGRSAVMGPIDYSMNYPCGLLVDGFDTPPRVMMNHHPIYYADLLESWGLGKLKDLHAWWLPLSSELPAKWHDRAERIARRTGVVIRPARTKDSEAEVERCKAIYNATWPNNWGFVPLSDAEFRQMAKWLGQIAREEQVLLAEVEGRPVGLCITVPDLNEAIRPLDGRLTWFGLPINLARFLYRMRRVKTARVLALGVLPEYRGRGIAELLILRTYEIGKKALGFTHAELGWTIEDNQRITSIVETIGARRYKTYRLYGKNLA